MDNFIQLLSHKELQKKNNGFNLAVYWVILSNLVISELQSINFWQF